MTARLVDGFTADGFEPVRIAFADVARAEPGLGAQLAAYRDGHLVVDLWTGMPGDAVTGLYSSAKGAAHLVVALLVQERVLELDRTVASYWPEFAAAGKDRVTLRDLLAHKAGVIGVDDGLCTEELADDQLLAARLAGQRPFWQPGSRHGYHAFVIGALTGEVVRRATGQSIQAIYEERVRTPYALDFHLGLPEAEEPRYVDVQPAPGPAAAPGLDPASLTAIAFNLHATPPTDLVEYANTRQVRALGPTSSGGVGNARGLARMYAAAITGVDGLPPLLTARTVADFSRVHSHGTDLVTGERDHFAVGFEAHSVRYPFLGPHAFSHSGAVGADAFADPDSGIAYGYTRHRFPGGGGGPAPENHRLASRLLQASAHVHA